MRLGSWQAKLVKDSFTYYVYKRFDQFIDKENAIIAERHRHRYEFNNAYCQRFEENGFHIVARSTIEGLVEIVEMDKKIHPFYIGIQGHPEYKSQPFKPHPLFVTFLEAVGSYK